MIVALVGRRIDPPDADVARFPAANAGLVRERLHALFSEIEATALVSSGACGADLLAMDVAGELGLRRRMVLPFESERFRAGSVADRPGDWGSLFDRVAAEVAADGGLVVLGEESEPNAAYAAANFAILDEAQRLASEHLGAERPGPRAEVLAVTVWDGRSRGPGDLTAAFANAARARNLPVTQVPTL
jgi:hypothetical protein